MIRRSRYPHCASESARLAGALADAGMRAGDRVAIWLPNGEEWAAPASWHARASARWRSAVNTRFRAREPGRCAGPRPRGLAAVLARVQEIDFDANPVGRTCRALRGACAGYAWPACGPSAGQGAGRRARLFLARDDGRGRPAGRRGGGRARHLFHDIGHGVRCPSSSCMARPPCYGTATRWHAPMGLTMPARVLAVAPFCGVFRIRRAGRELRAWHTCGVPGRFRCATCGWRRLAPSRHACLPEQRSPAAHAGCRARQRLFIRAPVRLRQLRAGPGLAARARRRATASRRRACTGPANWSHLVARCSPCTMPPIAICQADS